MLRFVKRSDKKYTRDMLKERQSDIWSKRVFELRLHLGLSQDDLASRLGVTRVSITSWESGKHVPQRLHRGLIERLEKETGVRA